MLRKVLSILVVYCFMMTNVCFAMPAAVGIKATVDNMALETFLTTETNPTQETFTKLLIDVVGKEYADEADGVFKMWQDNLSKINNPDAAAKLKAAVDATKSFNVPGITIEDDKLAIDVDGGQSSIADSKANEKALDATATQAIADGKTTEVADKSTDRGNLAAMLNTGNVTELKKQEILDAFDARSLHTMAPVVIDENNHLHGFATANTTYIDENLTGTDRTDMILHETLESLNSNIQDVAQRDAEVMKQQEAIHGGKDGVMASTRKAMDTSTAKVIAAEEAKTPADKVVISKDLLNKDSKDAGAQAEAMAIAEKAFAGDSDKLSKADPETVVTMVQALIKTRISEIVSSLQSAMGIFIPTATNAATTEQQAEAAVKIAEGLKDGEVLAMDYETLFTTQNGKVVPRVGATVLLDALNRSKVKDGAIQIISAVNITGAQDALDYLFPGIGEKIKINAGNESTLEVVNVNPSLLRVLYSNEASIQGDITDVSYILAPRMDKVNGLQVLIAALAPNLKSLTASEQAILSDLGNGKFELQNVEIDDAAYTAMQEEYKTVVDILIQA